MNIFLYVCIDNRDQEDHNLLKSVAVALVVTISSYNNVVRNSLNFSPLISGKKYLAASANLFLSPNGPVSYTHLDVYKRQALE